MATALLCYKIFGLSEVTDVILARWRAKAATASAVR
jgi:hypothetical protein